jgi:hypothetical protein
MVDSVHRAVDRARGGSPWAYAMDGAELHRSLAFGRSGRQDTAAMGRGGRGDSDEAHRGQIWAVEW